MQSPVSLCNEKGAVGVALQDLTKSLAPLETCIAIWPAFLGYYLV